MSPSIDAGWLYGPAASLAAIASTEAKVTASCAHPADLADVRRRHTSNARWATKRMPPLTMHTPLWSRAGHCAALPERSGGSGGGPDIIATCDSPAFGRGD